MIDAITQLTLVVAGLVLAAALYRIVTGPTMADRVAAFGGCIALNRAVDTTTAEAISKQYSEVVVAPDFEEGAMDIFAKKKNLRVIRITNIDRLNLGPVPTVQLNWLQPHEGNIVDFLYRARAFQTA